MNKDDMSDDAEFDAFLRGEGNLARDLQGLAQPTPSAALDAAILAQARAAMAQDSRRVAANDSGEATFAPAPRHARSLGWRWQIPAGIAATVLVGVFANQTFQSAGGLGEVAAPAAPMAESAAALPPEAEVAPAPAQEIQSVPAPAMAPEPVQEVSPKPASEAREQKRVAPAAPLRREETVAPPAPAPAPAPAAPAPMAEEKADDFARKEQAAQPRKADAAVYDRAERSRANSSNYSQDNAAVRAAPAAAPAPQYSPFEALSPSAAPAPAPLAKPTLRPSPLDSQTVTVSGRRNKVEVAGDGYATTGVLAGAAPTDGAAAKQWLDRIEKLLEQGRRDEALEEWKTFKSVNPGYPVPAATREKLE